VAIFFELHLQKKFGEVLDPYQLLIGRKFKYLLKNGILKFLERGINPE
jgi:hypothetical protein